MLTSLGNNVSTCCRATRLLDWDLMICTLTESFARYGRGYHRKRQLLFVLVCKVDDEPEDMSDLLGR